MNFGKSIRLYLQDGTVSGLKFGEVVNQTIQSVSCPRKRLGELAKVPEAQRPGVYFLFEKLEGKQKPVVYIGEAENVFIRLQDHLKKKDFWNEVVFFVSKDDNLTKAHVKFLESRILEMAQSADRYELENSQASKASVLPRADEDAMQEFALYLKLLLGVLGYKGLEPLIPEQKPLAVTTNSAEKPEQQVLYCNTNGVKAQAIQTDEGFVVLKGSEARITEKESLTEVNQEHRRQLVDDALLNTNDGKYIFQKDVLFSSPSAAAAIVAGANRNGLRSWKNEAGKSLKEMEAERV